MQIYGYYLACLHYSLIMHLLSTTTVSAFFRKLLKMLSTMANLVPCILGPLPAMGIAQEQDHARTINTT